MVQKLHICKKVYFDQLLDFPILLLLFPHSLLVCHILLFECLIFFNTIRVSKVNLLLITRLKSILFGSNLFHLVKVLATAILNQDKPCFTLQVVVK